MPKGHHSIHQGSSALLEGNSPNEVNEKEERLVWFYGLMTKIREDLCKEQCLKGYIFAFALTILKSITGNLVSVSMMPKQSFIYRLWWYVWMIWNLILHVKNYVDGKRVLKVVTATKAKQRNRESNHWVTHFLLKILDLFLPWEYRPAFEGLCAVYHWLNKSCKYCPNEWKTRDWQSLLSSLTWQMSHVMLWQCSTHLPIKEDIVFLLFSALLLIRKIPSVQEIFAN